MFLILSLLQNEKTYPMAQKYMNSYYLMQNYYSVHPVPSKKRKREKKRHGSEKFHIFTGRRYFSCVLIVNPYGIYLLLIIRSFLSIKSIFPEESHLIPAWCKTLRTNSALCQKPQTGLTYQFVLPHVFRVGLAEVWHF